MDLAILSDATLNLKIVTLDFRGEDKDIADIISSVSAFKSKLDYWKLHTTKKSLLQFQNMKKVFWNLTKVRLILCLL